jgi:hypothetical protein
MNPAPDEWNGAMDALMQTGGGSRSPPQQQQQQARPQRMSQLSPQQQQQMQLQPMQNTHFSPAGESFPPVVRQAPQATFANASAMQQQAMQHQQGRAPARRQSSAMVPFPENDTMQDEYIDLGEGQQDHIPTNNSWDTPDDGGGMEAAQWSTMKPSNNNVAAEMHRNDVLMGREFANPLFTNGE